MATMTPLPVREVHRRALADLPLDAWDAYLTAHSNLPGPRANLELLEVVGDVAPAGYLMTCAASDDEYRAAVGAAGLGRLAADGDGDALVRLRALAEDDRWRVREGVAMALQRIGDRDRRLLATVTDAWAAGPPLVQRAAVAGECEPRLLDTPSAAAHAVALLDRVTGRLAALPADRRRDADVRTLRQALGYCWSVAVAADPSAGFPVLRRWALSDDDDVRWVLRRNAGKARLRRADAAATDALAVALAGR